MTPALTVKSQVTIPKAIRDFLGLSPGERVSFEPLPDGRVAISPANKEAKPVDNPFAQFKGVLTTGMTTDELMRMTRGNDWNKP
jgi:antitoxin PrlF